MANDDSTKKIVEFVGSSISSKTFREELKSQVAADPILSQVPEASLLASLIDTLLKDPINPHLADASSGDNGFCVAEVSAAEIVVTMHRIPGEEVVNDYLGRYEELAPLIEKVQFKAVDGERELYMFDDSDMAWKRWDPVALDWV
jgi:alkaline phosphatase D